MARITKSALDRWRYLNDQRKRLDAESRALRAEIEQIEHAAQADLISSGRDSISRGGYRITLAESRASIAWKNELVARLGAETAADIAASAPVRQRLQIIPPPAAPDTQA